MTDPFMPTRQSLLSRLKDPGDWKAWTEFFNSYGELIYRTACKAGLTDAEAQDVVQETLIVVARKIPGFKYDPALGSFKSWLLLITRRRIEKQLKKRLPASHHSTSCGSGVDDRQRTSTVERLPDPQNGDLQTAWDLDWEKNLWKIAVARVKAQVKPKQFQMFDLYVLKEWPVEEVARALGVSQTNVYVTKHRVGTLLKKHMRKLAQQPF